MKQRTVLFSRRLSRAGYTGDTELLHVETEGAIVNIRIGLWDVTGRPVTSIEIIPDQEWTRDGYANTRVTGPAEQGV